MPSESAEFEAIAALPELGDLWQETCGWQPDAVQLQQLQQLYAAVAIANRRLNLTRILDPEAFWEKHLWDSLRAVAGLGWLQGTPARVLDIGTGGGFPGFPVAICAPQTTVTLNDATRKKVAFLEEATAQLSLQNVRTRVGRAEELGQHPGERARYDAALLRAVAPPVICAEYGLPLVKVGGTVVLYCGRWSDADAEALAPISRLGGELAAIQTYKLPLSEGERHCLYLRKVARTPPAFPRPVGVPAKHPLALQ